MTKNANYRKHNDRTHNSSTYHKKDGTPTRHLLKQEAKKEIDDFVKETGIYASYCNSCEVWQVHCPECNRNWCGSGCDCGYSILLDRKQSQLDEILSTLEKEGQH